MAWLAILLGLLLQLAVLAAGFGKDISPRPVLAETLKTVSWSLLVCVGIALGRVAANGRPPLAGATGLLAAPLEWVGRRAWGRALGHLAVGLLTGVVFGGLFLAVVVRSAPTPLSTPSLVARGLNELLFPLGCALCSS